VRAPPRTAIRPSGTSCRIARTSRWKWWEGSGYPLRFIRYELVEDSGGAGKWRGGLGVTRQLELTLADRADGKRRPARHTAAWLVRWRRRTVNRFSIVRDGQDRTFKEWFKIPSPSKFSNMPTRLGDVLAVTQGGGGGYGDPLERTPALVRPMSSTVTYRAAREKRIRCHRRPRHRDCRCGRRPSANAGSAGRCAGPRHLIARF